MRTCRLGTALLLGVTATMTLSAATMALHPGWASAEVAVRPETPPETRERLVALGKLWGAVRFTHPWFGYQDIDWDGALLAAIPRVYAAATAEEYTAVVRTMLAVLADPVTRVVPPVVVPAPPGPPAPAAGGPPFKWPAPGIVRAPIGDLLATKGFQEIAAAGKAIAEASATATGIILDLRSQRPRRDDEVATFLSWSLYRALAGALTSRAVTLPTSRSLLHSGWRADSGYGGFDYRSVFVTEPTEVITPRRGPRPLAVVFLADGGSPLPPLALALQAAGRAWIVADGPLDDSAVVKARRLAFGGVTIAVRTHELLIGAHAAPLRPDRVVERGLAGGPDRALAVALGLAHTPRAGRAAAAVGAPLPLAPIWRPNPGYPEMHFPDLPHRLLALFRFWTIIAHLDPYLPLVGDWDAALPKYLARMEAVGDARAYALVIAEMAAALHDGHAEVAGSPALVDFFGQVSPPVSVLVVEQKVVVTRLTDPAARAAGLAVGDEIVRLDGESVAALMARLAPYIPASTPAQLSLRAASRMLRGPAGSQVVLTVRNPRGALVDVTLPRVAATPPGPTEPPFRVLAGNVGYVDLVRLQLAEVDAAFDALATTRAIVFDMRGYPKGTAWSIAPRLNVREARHGAVYERVQVGGGDSSRLRYFDDLPPSTSPLYRGKTVLLIDERAVSQSEHSGLFFREAAGMIFIGSHTAGADGDRTDFVLPGGITVPFTGSDVHHVDGSRLQGVGLVPDVEVKPTIAGIRAGRDEVLEAALRYLGPSAGPAGGAE